LKFETKNSVFHEKSFLKHGLLKLCVAEMEFSLKIWFQHHLLQIGKIEDFESMSGCMSPMSGSTSVGIISAFGEFRQTPKSAEMAKLKFFF
jgi:hypothetical protein